jgi:hypothetical protein
MRGPEVDADWHAQQTENTSGVKACITASDQEARCHRIEQIVFA